MNVLRNHNLAKISVIGLASLGALTLAHEVGGCAGGDGISLGNLSPGLGAGTSEATQVSTESAIENIHPEGQYMIAQSDGTNTTEITAHTKANLVIWHPTLPFTKRSVWVKRSEHAQVMLRGEALDLKPATINGVEGIEADITINPTAKSDKEATLYTQHVNPITLDHGGDSEFFSFPSYDGTISRALHASDYADIAFERDCGPSTLPAAAEGVRIITRAFLRAKMQENAATHTKAAKALINKQSQLANGPIEVHFKSPDGTDYGSTNIPVPKVDVPKDAELQDLLGKSHTDLLSNSVHMNNKVNNKPGDQSCNLNPRAVQQTVDMIMKSQSAGAPSTATPGV